ncbi:MAG: hypothetical protein KDC53_24830 [Saprospiraceae bacterium]|nr:hypothetical protein [Saprospiraceae bacterium]
MKTRTIVSRRNALSMATFGILGIPIPLSLSARNLQFRNRIPEQEQDIPRHFPNLDPERVLEVVGKSHFDLESVRKLVEARPELAKSTWEWRFGDFESAIGAASHVGRRDIAQYLMSKGARPTIFTFAMLGAFEVVKAAIDFQPGIQRTTGPHGLSLLSHTFAGERMKDEMTNSEIDNLQRTIEFLEKLGDANGENYIDLGSAEQQKYLGDYRYGPGEKDGFTININMRKLLSLAPLGGFGGALYKTGENRFIYNGAPSVVISFDIQEEVVKSLKITDPDITILAEKVS